MKSIKQMLRQPMKTAAGILLVTIAVVVLCVCVGQSFAALATQERLNRSFLSIALPMTKKSFIIIGGDSVSQKVYTEEADAWATTFAVKNPDIVESISSPGLVSAYIPDMEIVHFNEDYRVILNEQNGNAPHDCTLIEFTLTEEPEIYELQRVFHVENGDIVYSEDGVPVSAVVEEGSIRLTGTIEQVFGLQDGWADPTGYTVRVNFSLPSVDVSNYTFVVGERYLIYTSNYYDSDYYLRAMIARYKNYEFQETFEPDDLIPIIEEENAEIMHAPSPYAARLRINGNNIMGLSETEVLLFRSISASVCNQAALPKYEFVKDKNGGYIIQYINTQEYITVNGEVQEISQQEYSTLYPGLTITHLDGSAEEFLESEVGEPWRKALDDIEVNNHAFPVICIDSMTEVTDFARSMAEVMDGREFNPKELAEGARVCLISASLAKANDLQVGDVLELQLYSGDPNLPYQHRLAAGDAPMQPSACYFYSETTTLDNPKPYTIVGIYQAETEWTDEDTNRYGFTPNTIFVPKASVSTKIEYGSGGFYRNFIIANGRLDDFQAAILEAGYDGQLYLNDNGYSAVEGSMDSYRENAQRAMIVGIVVYMVITLVFLVLFPGRQGSTIAIMESLGVPRWDRIRHVCVSSLTVLLPSTLLGVVAGLLLWQQVVDTLTKDAASLLSIEMDPITLAVIALASFVVELFAVFLISIPLARGKSLNNRK